MLDIRKKTPRARRHRTKTLVTVLLMLTSIAIMASTPAPLASTRTIVRGHWYDDGSPCLVPTAGSLGPGVPPQTFSFSCIGGTIDDGDWFGHTIYNASGTVDFSTGDFYATAEQWFTGIYSKDGSFGGLHFTSVVTGNISTGEFHDSSRIIDGTCAFSGSRGRIEFDGEGPASLISGSYVGSWSRNANPHHDRACLVPAP